MASPASAVDRPAHFLGLDGMRGVLAMGVVLFHFGFNSFAERKLGWLGINFRLCVDVFFLLSGFVLTHAARSGIRRFDFIIKRGFRLLPVYWLTTSIILLVAQLPVPFLDWVLLTPIWGGELANGPAWSIFAELFFPILAVLLPFKIPQRWVWPLLVAVLLGLGWADIPLAAGDGGHHVRGSLGLLGGHLLYRTQASGRGPLVGWMAALVLVMAASLYFPPAGLVLPIIACAAIVAGVTDDGILRAAPFQWLGAISYTVYLAHMPVLFTMKRLWGDAFDDNAPLKLVGIAVSVVVAIALTFAVERPCMRLGGTLLRRLRSERSAPGLPR